MKVVDSRQSNMGISPGGECRSGRIEEIGPTGCVEQTVKDAFETRQILGGTPEYSVQRADGGERASLQINRPELAGRRRIINVIGANDSGQG